MVKLGLTVKAEFENVSKVAFEMDTMKWWFKVRCLNCGEITPEHVYVSAEEEEETMIGGRGTTHLNIKCKFCERHNNVRVISAPGGADNAPLVDWEVAVDEDGAAENDNKGFMIVAFDCRGVELEEWQPRDGWSVIASSGTVYDEEIDLAEGEWYEFDEKSGNPVSIQDITHEFVAFK